jgi:hypothetical protein
VVVVVHVDPLKVPDEQAYGGDKVAEYVVSVRHSLPLSVPDEQEYVGADVAA